MDDRYQRGVTLIEVLLALVLLVVLVTRAIPAFGQWLDRQRLQGTARAIAADLQLAREEAVSQADSRPVYLHFRTGTGWCYGITRRPDCDCRRRNPAHPEACLFTRRNVQRLARKDSGPYQGIILKQARFARSTSLRFDSLRGMARAGRVELENRHGERLQVRVSPLGRIRICRPGGRGQRGIEAC